ncbi:MULTISPECIES: hypothetical protein [unclassified Microbacterium]|uniref:hypothetical protein n=1 Tax=unclassified Microbacterium TaxID=2609290 RepID=UPI003866133B
MNYDHAENAKRYHERITDLNRIATRTDPNLTPGGLAAWQRSETVRWRHDLAQITIGVPKVPDRSTVLDALKPRTADDLALAARECEKVTARRAAGQPIEAIIATADRSRLAAILDDVEVADDVLASAHGDAIIAERKAAIFDRLAEIDDDARAVIDAEAAAEPAQAWAAVFEDIGQYGLAGMGSKTALYRVDPSAYSLVEAAEREIDAAAIGRLLGSANTAL